MYTPAQSFFHTFQRIRQPYNAAKFSTEEKFSTVLRTGLPPQPQRRVPPSARNQGAIQLLASWMAEDAALTPAEQQAALAEWGQLQRLLDEETSADARLLP
jgi:hypothetical protein